MIGNHAGRVLYNSMKTRKYRNRQMTNWYTADPHFGHENIIKLCNRPFETLAQMDAILMENLNARVGPKDRLWIIGDFAYGRKSKNRKWLAELFHQLPGAEQHLIIGNHDLASTNDLPWTSIGNHGPAPTLDLPWTSINHMAEVRDGSKNQVHTLFHYPMLTWNHARHDALQIFGHVHGNWKGSRNCVNAGVDVWDFAPVRFEELEARARALPVNKHWRDVEPGHWEEEPYT